MENLIISHTSQTPGITFLTNGSLAIKGISTPENVQKFYQYIFDWLNEFKKTNPPHITINFEIDYLNTMSSRIFLELLALLKSFKENGTELNFIWTYEDDDDDLMELGEDLAMSAKIEFVFKTKTSE